MCESDSIYREEKYRKIDQWVLSYNIRKKSVLVCYYPVG